MATIRDIHTPWRDALLPAMFDGVPFFCDTGVRETGRRAVVHEYPKRDTPYAEDMGRRAVQYSVRGYVISYVRDAGLNLVTPDASVQPVGGFAASLYMRDYRIARDLLQARLDEPGEGVLQLPNMGRAAFGDVLTLTAVCSGYRMTEEDRLGGFCVFDMTFVEFGLINLAPPAPAVTLLQQQANGLYTRITQNLNPSTATSGKAIVTQLPGGFVPAP
jgi:hypothetical protein